MADRLRNKQAAKLGHGFFIYCGGDRREARLLWPPAIVPNMGAIYPRNRPAFDAACGALQRVIWSIDIKNYLVTFDAISNVSVHGTIPHKPLVPPEIIPRSSRPDESKWQGTAADTK
jgi:hypothetical protein